MTIHQVGDQVRKRDDQATIYTVEDVKGDEYRLTVGEGDKLRTSFARGFELTAASNEVEKPEANAEGTDQVEPDLTGEQLEDIGRKIGSHAPTFDQIPPPSDLERADAQDNPLSLGRSQSDDDR
jgi:hypothetical protein